MPTAANGNLGLEPEKLGKTYDELYPPRPGQFHDVFFAPTTLGPGESIW
jgi:hypothetical protein